MKDQSTYTKNKEDQYAIFKDGERKEEKGSSTTNHLTINDTHYPIEKGRSSTSNYMVDGHV